MTPITAAQQAQRAVIRAGSLLLDYSPASLGYLDEIVEKIRGEEQSLDQVLETLVELGCYVGEVIVRHLDGVWILGQATSIPVYEENSLVIRLPNGIHCQPLNKIYKRFEDSENDSIVLYYRALKHLGADAEWATKQRAVQDSKPVKLGPIEAALFRLSLEANARAEAFHLVQKVEGRIEAIDAEIKQQLDRISAFDGKGPMAPGASPRRWKEHYITALHEARTLIESKIREGKTWSVED